MSTLKIYEINPYYVKYLSANQKHMFISDDDKTGRKYIGVVLSVNGFSYFAPLTSYKAKHDDMKGHMEIIRIKKTAVINLNNMIPVPEGEYHLVAIDREKDPHYRYLLQSEVREINRQRQRIEKSAHVVYWHKIIYGMSTKLAQRTNDFAILEKMCNDYYQ